MSEQTIIVNNLTKKYRIGFSENHNDTIIGSIFEIIKSPFRNFRNLNSLQNFGVNEESIISVLDNISFSLCKGDTLGIIGKNGAGKSTLLKILSRVTEPTSGSAIIKGRVGSLLEVGTGFHPELTGKENIYLSGSILGMRKKEIDAKFKEIVDFSEIAKFIDTPIKRYSSGMKVRLGFSVSAHLEPEIMIIDEVLAVGDISFQEKCIKKIKELRNKGLTILFVSHNMAAVQNVCKKAILLDEGKILSAGSTSSVIDSYRDLIYRKQEKREKYSKKDNFKEKISITDFRIFDKKNIEINEIKFNSEVIIKIKLFANEKIELPLINFGLLRGDGVNICNFNNFYDNFKIDYVEGEFEITVYLPALRLISDYYEPWILVWPWQALQKNGEIDIMNPYTYKTYPPIKFSGIDLHNKDGVFQIPAKKWEYKTGDKIIEYEGNKNSIYVALKNNDGNG